jgi:hypothetical protein
MKECMNNIQKELTKNSLSLSFLNNECFSLSEKKPIFTLISPRDLATHIFEVESLEEKNQWIQSISSIFQQWKQQKLKEKGISSENISVVPSPDEIRLGLDLVIPLLKVWKTASFQISQTVPIRSKTVKEFTVRRILLFFFNNNSLFLLKE